MKRILATVILSISTTILLAQTVKEGKQHYYYERFMSAQAVLSNVLDKDPANSEAWFWLIRSYLSEKEMKKAGDSLANAPVGIQSDPYYLLAKGAVLLNDNKIQEANMAFQQTIDKTRGKDVDILAGIADVNIDAANGDLKYAIDLLQSAIKRDKKNATLYTSLGKAYLKMHDGSEAFKALREASEKDKSEAAAYYQLGQIFASQKNTDMYLDYFTQAINADQQYAPAYYALYNHYLYREPARAMGYFLQYASNADYNLQGAYSYTDLLYLNNKYDSAIMGAKELVETLGEKVQPRLYKLIGYCYQGKADTISALNYMREYFKNEADSNFVIKDYENMGAIYSSFAGKEDSAATYYEKALAISPDSVTSNTYYQTLAKLAKKINDNESEAKWLGKYYLTSRNPSNVTLFNWGLAAYKAEDYHQADSVFSIYTEKYPEQGFGYFWRARSNAAIDTTMEQGLAIPYYQQLIEVLNKDTLTASDKKWITEAYFYLASYETNHKKDYPTAINYFGKVLEINPDNEQARKYMEMLEKNIESSGASK